MSRLQKFLVLPSEERRLLVQASFWLGAVRIALRVVPFGGLLNRMEMVARHPASHVNAERITWAVDTASRYIPGARTCLPRALATTILLRRAGHPADLRIGLARGSGSRTEAHAWVESEGRVVIGAQERERYVLISGMRGAVE